MGVLNADYSSTSRTEYLSCILTTGTFILFDNFWKKLIPTKVVVSLGVFRGDRSF
ncbi:hypothetical protein [Nostoc sp.]|uniref:hypothetical protein n=1 Tax=Nostoc sp. TaxID=1180 RepID=UPI002FF9A4EE